MQFDVRALSADHLVVRLRLDARDAADARSQVEARGLQAAAIDPVRPARVTGLRWRTRGQSRFSVTLFSQELLALLSAGLSLVEALEALREKEAGVVAATLLDRLLAGLREGKRFSRVLAAHPDVFPALYVGIVQAAENTSGLPQALERYLSYQQRVDSVRGKLISAAIYPLILLGVGSAVSLFLVGYVVPRFAEVYQGAGRSLPWLSQLLLDWGQFAGRHGSVLMPGAVALIIAAALGVRALLSRRGMAALLRRIPALGERVHIVELSRLYLTLGMLLEGGIHIVAALDTAQGMAGTDMRGRLDAARQAIQQGQPLSAAFEGQGLVTPISVRMLRVGERSGELGAMLTQSANFYDGEISRWIDRFMRMFEPLLMTAIGLVVGTIVVLLYMPIFDLAGGLT